MRNRETDRHHLKPSFPELQTIYQEPTPEYLASLKDFLQKSKLPPSLIPVHLSTLVPDYGQYYFDPYFKNKRDKPNRNPTNITTTSRNVPKRMTNLLFPRFVQGEKKEKMTKRKIPVAIL